MGCSLGQELVLELVQDLVLGRLGLDSELCTLELERGLEKVLCKLVQERGLDLVPGRLGRELDLGPCKLVTVQKRLELVSTNHRRRKEALFRVTFGDMQLNSRVPK